MAGLSFAANIRKLFRDYDVQSMVDYGIDLSQYEDVKAHAEDIYARLVDGDMPCDNAWDAEKLNAFKTWMDDGMQP